YEGWISTRPARAELGHMNVVRKRHGLDGLISSPHILRREVVPVCRRNGTPNNQKTENNL
ncbi:MAG TPA: hypothetical protein VGH07_06250, partial [Chthoniobacterales bacterium]